MLTGVGNVMNSRSIRGAIRQPFAGRRPTYALANLCAAHIQLRQGPAQGVAVHPEFLGSLALVAPVMRQHLEDVALLELAYSLVVGDSGTMHLRNQNIQFALQKVILTAAGSAPLYRSLPILYLIMQLDPIGVTVFQVEGTESNPFLELG